MITNYKRKITEEERKIIERDANLRLVNIRKEVIIIKKIFWLLFFCSLIGAFYLYLSDFKINSFLGWISGTVIIFFLISLWSYVEIVLRDKREVKEISEFPKEIDVIHCKSNKAILFKEWGDTGVHFLFQVEPNKMFFIGGQEYNELKKLPNNDFKIIKARRPNGFYYFWQIVANGAKFKPIKVVSSENVNKLCKNRKHPSLLFDNESVVDCKIEDFDLG